MMLVAKNLTSFSDDIILERMNMLLSYIIETNLIYISPFMEKKVSFWIARQKEAIYD
jgi:hypothetical protein